MKATIALAVDYQDGSPKLLDVLSDSREITILESALSHGDGGALQKVYEHREKIAMEDEEFSIYVEDLLSKPFIKTEIQEHGVQWLKSKIRIEQFQKNELDAARVIADYAFEVFRTEHKRDDFMLAGPTSEVRIRVFVLNEQSESFQNAA
jgi:hypothetical protein